MTRTVKESEAIDETQEIILYINHLSSGIRRLEMKRTREEIPLLCDEIRAFTTTFKDVNRIMAKNEVLLKAILTETRRSRVLCIGLQKRQTKHG